MIFEPWGHDSVEIVRSMLLKDEIWNPQATDDVRKEDVAKVEFPGSWVAVLFDDKGAAGNILFTPLGNSVYEQHTNIMERARGVSANAFVQDAGEAIFMRSDAVEVVTRCPDWAPHVSRFARSNGMRPYFHQPEFKVRGGQEFGCMVMGITAMEWAHMNHAKYSTVGAAWHKQVFAVAGEHHGHDAAHDGFLGMALTMGRAQPIKAIAIYDAWARLAGYASAKLLSWSPTLSVIDAGDCIVVQNADTVLSVTPKMPINSTGGPLQAV